MHLVLGLSTVIAVVSAVKVNPLPKPQSVKWSKSGGAIEVTSGDLSVKGTHNDIIAEAVDRMHSTVKELKWYPAAVEEPVQSFEPLPTDLAKRDNEGHVGEIRFNVKDLDSELQFKVDESYTLDVADNGIKIDAETTWGALHAITTLQQLIIYDNGKFLIEGPVKIEDKPNYPWRAVMLDTGRNWYNIPSIKRQIDAMAMSKLNTFHWHLTDTQSWAIEIDSFPEMQKDAFSKRQTYSKSDIKGVVDYAYKRGVRVVPEVDLPGHSSSGWKQIDPKLVPCADCFWNGDPAPAYQPNPGQLDIIYEKTYEVLEKVYKDLSALFKDNHFHVGMDELNTNCYNWSQPIQEWFKEDKSRTWFDLAQYWIDKSAPIFSSVKGRKLVMWEDSVLSADISAKNVSKDILMQSWSDHANVKKLAGMGYDVIVSSSDFFYLDCGVGSYALNIDTNVQVNPYPNGTDSLNYGGDGGSSCGPYKSWQRIYYYDPKFNLTDEEHEHVVGIETPLWSEQSDSAVVDAKFWPRAASMAEVAWSGNRDSDGNSLIYSFEQRLYNFREYLVEIGVNAAPVTSQYCLQHPHACATDLNATSYYKPPKEVSP